MPDLNKHGEDIGKLKHLWPFLKMLLPYKWWILLGFLLTVGTLFSSIGLLAVSGWFLTGTALAGGTAALTAIAYNFFQPAAMVRGFAIARTAGRWAERVVNHEATFRLLAQFRTWLFAGIAPLSARQRQKYHGGTLLNRITRDIDALDNLYVRLLLPVAAALVLMLLIAVVLINMLPSLWLPSVILLLAGFVILPLLAWWLGKVRAPQALKYQQQLRVDLLEVVDGMETLSLNHSAWQLYIGRALATSRAWLGNDWQLHWRASGLRNVLAMLIAAMSLLALALMSASDLGGIWIGGITLLLLACGELLLPLADAWLRLSATCTAAYNLKSLQSQQSEIVYPAKSADIQNFDLKIKNLDYQYDGGQIILDQLNLSLPQGTHALLQGESGGGKSTLVQILTRQLLPAGGAVLLGGARLEDFCAADLKRYITCAAQEPYIFTASIGDNLRLGNANASEEDLWQVLALVDLAEFVRTLPQQLNTWTDEGGANLSGGQRRRLGLARALLVDAQVVILDEPSEGLDVAQEKRLIDNIGSHLAGKTLLWVSHRSTAKDAFACQLCLRDGRLQAL